MALRFGKLFSGKLLEGWLFWTSSGVPSGAIIGPVNTPEMTVVKSTSELTISRIDASVNVVKET